MDVKPAATRPAKDRNEPGKAGLAQENPLVQPDNARPGNTLHRRLLVGRASESNVELPGFCSGTQRMRASLRGPTTHDVEHEHQPNEPREPQNSSHVPWLRATLPRPPQSINIREEDGDPDTDLSFRLTFLPHQPGTRWAKRAANHAGPTGSPMTTGMLYRAQPAASSRGIGAHNRER